MRAAIMAWRTGREVLRDPATTLLGVGLPLVVLVVLSSLQRSIAVPIFAIDRFAPAIALFSLAFIALFAGSLIASDRRSAFLTRLFSSPLSAFDYIAGYSLPFLPIGIAQSAVAFIAASFFGLPFNGGALLSITVLIAAVLLFVSLGLFLGSLFTDRQTGGIMTIIIQVVAFLSGMWFDLEAIGGAFEAIGNVLPFSHALAAARIALTGDLRATVPHLLWVAGYTVVLFVSAVAVFRRQMKA